jgi:hypothetical protein
VEVDRVHLGVYCSVRLSASWSMAIVGAVAVFIACRAPRSQSEVPYRPRYL